MSVISLQTKAEFDQLIENNPLVALQAHASWCGPCKMISPIFEKAAGESTVDGKYVFAKFDTDDVSDLAQELGIRSIPAFFFFEKGTKVNTVVGPTPPVLNVAIKELGAKVEA